MAITTIEKANNKRTQSSCSKSANLNSNKLAKFNSDVDGSISSNLECDSKQHTNRSPYVNGNTIQLLSRVTEKKMVHNKTGDFMSSFPLAVNIYRANSDHLRSSKRINKKAKKSVLTLPNKQAPLPIACTVSDLNDSECFDDSNNVKPKHKKRRSIKNKHMDKSKDIKQFDTSSKTCSQFPSDLEDKCSINTINKFNGDGKTSMKRSNKKSKKPNAFNNLKFQDVWSVLRNINHIKLKPSLSISQDSQDSFISPKERRSKNRRRSNQKDTRYIETCRTEEFAYISSFLDRDSLQNSYSQSSIDKITVISKQDHFEVISDDSNKDICMDDKFFGKKNKKSIEFKKPSKQVAIGTIKYADEKNKVICNKDPQQNIQTSVISEKDENNSCIKRKPNAPKKNNISNFLINTARNIQNKFISTDVSQCSKDNLTNSKLIMDTNNVHTLNGEEPQDMTGITKVVLSKGQKTKQLDEAKRKTRLVTTLPTNCTIPRLTQTEIKRRLSCIRFPLDILGKDQVSSTIKVENYDPPQFKGLNEHIWPFMKDWYPKNACDDIKHKNVIVKDTNSPVSNKRKKYMNINALLKGKKVEKPQVLTDQEERKKEMITINIKEPAVRRSKQVKNSINTMNRDIFKLKIEESSIQSKVNITEPSNIILNNDNRKKPLYDTSYQWTKRKRANEVIENIIRKLNAGLYSTGVCEEVRYDDVLLADSVNVNETKLEEFAGTDKTTLSRFEEVKNFNEIAVKKDKITINIKEPAVRRAKQVKNSINTMNREISKLKIGERSIQNKVNIIKPSKIILNNDSHKKPLYDTSYQWTKRKRANEVIENIIKKLNAGLYSTGVCEEVRYDDVLLTDSVKVDETKLEEFAGTDKTTLSRFEDKLSDIEIETVENFNEIAVKHCITNTVIKFDIVLKQVLDCTSSNESFSYIPIKETGSSKIFKCKTTIVNAVLPAEICTILPYIMRKIMKNTCNIVLSSSTIKKVDNKLPCLPESEFGNTQMLKPFISLQIESTPAVRLAKQGRFPKLAPLIFNHNLHVVKKNFKWIRSTFNLTDTRDLLKSNQINLMSIATIKTPITPSILNHKQSVEQSPKENFNSNYNCLAMVPYTVSDKKVFPAFKKLNCISFIESCLSYTFLQLNINAPFINVFSIVIRNINNISVTVFMGNIKEPEGNLVSTVSKIQVDSIYEGFKSRIKNIEDVTFTSDKHNDIDTKPNKNHREKRKSRTEFHLNRKRSFVKFYKKCKSTTNICNERSSTDINKITNMDEFFLSMGTTKALSSVIDAKLDKKITSSIREMKNWISDLTPRQAFLILLLANKKDTPNLIRYRPIILQGIAVNRITRCTELDMEIEVIETENLNGLRRYDGISFLPSPMENQENLFEELCWIAKTTASDYQKTFDESSERHLKSLLEKRKKLNPSYLRVMARYVGLGLLKCPK